MSDRYHIVQLANGAFSLRSEAYKETFHPVVGPVAEAQSLYVEQLNLVERLANSDEPFVVWDVGLGAGGNPLTFLNAVKHLQREVRIVSFDYTTEPLLLATENAGILGYMPGWESVVRQLAAEHRISSKVGSGLTVDWELHLGDFPLLLKSGLDAPPPHAIFYDAFSPATNPAMWTLDVFTKLFQKLHPSRPCTMPTYSRSTMLRVTLLLAGFYVGVGHPTGEKEETTIAANVPSLLLEPLERSWLMRAKRSGSAEPLHEPTYRQAPLSDETWERLRSHPQFS